MRLSPAVALLALAACGESLPPDIGANKNAIWEVLKAYHRAGDKGDVDTMASYLAPEATIFKGKEDFARPKDEAVKELTDRVKYFEGQARSILATLREGWQFVRARRVIVGTLMVTVVVNFWGFAYITMVPVIGERLSASDVTTQAELEVTLSRAVVAYAGDLKAGRLVPNEVDSEFQIHPERPDAGLILAGIALAGDVTTYLAGFAPQTPNYARLKQTLADYRAIAARGGWRQVSEGESLKPGMVVLTVGFGAGLVWGANLIRW